MTKGSQNRRKLFESQVKKLRGAFRFQLYRINQSPTLQSNDERDTTAAGSFKSNNRSFYVLIWTTVALYVHNSETDRQRY